MQPIEISIDLSVLLPQILLAVGGVLLLVVSIFRGGDRLGLPIALLTLGITAWVLAGRWGESADVGNGMLVVDELGVAFGLLLLVVGAMACLLSGGYLGPAHERRAEYYSLLVFCVLGMMVMAQSRNFVSLFLGLEIFSLCLYLLSAYTWRRTRALESSMKYFLLGAFSSGFILYGMALTYGSLRTLNMQTIGTVLLQRQAAPNLVLLAGLGLLIVGLAFKIGIAPFHFWIPDVYEGAPASVTAFMAAGTKVAAFAALMRVLDGFGDLAFAERWSPLLGILAAFTMTMANLVAITQTNLKRLLAYSSVAHAGYILLALATNTVKGVESLTFYLVTYVFANLGAFAVAIAVGRATPDKEEGYRLADLAGLGRRRPFLAACMTVFMLSLTGIPPMAGFLGKWFVFWSAMDAGMVGFAIILALNSTIAAYYYLGVIVKMYMTEPEGEIAPAHSSGLLTFSAGLAVAAVLYLGLFPTRVLTLLGEMAVRFWGQIHSI